MIRFNSVSGASVSAGARAVAMALLASLLLAVGVQTASAQGTAAERASVRPLPANDPGAPLPTDERLKVGRLENGLSYVVRRHRNPIGRVGLWLHIKSGSLNETDGQRGLAHYLEHMAFNGSENFPPGEVVKYFESIGLTFGRDQNAFTGFDQTAYQLYLPDAERETLARGLLFFGDVADRLLLNEEDIEEERGIIFEELRTDRGPAQRLRDQWLERLAPGSLIGVRLPIGTEETLAAVGREDFVDYYGKWYVPGKMTVIVVGDLDPSMAVEEIEKAFGGMEERPVPDDADAGVRAYTERRAIVAHDPELTEAEVALLVVDEPEAPVTTEGGFRRQIVRQLGIEAFNRRLASKVDEGEARLLGGGAFAQNIFGALRFAQASGASEPTAWGEGLEDLTLEVRRAELHGFSESEIEVARASMLGRMEQDAQQEPTMPARVILARLSGKINADEPLTSPSQALELARRMVGTIGRTEVNREFAGLFDTSRATFMVQLPTDAGVPSESEVLAFASGVADRSPEPDEETDAAESLIDGEPVGGEVVELSGHPASGVWTAVLSNGVVVHHREMTQRENLVDVRITLLGGQIEEDASNRGVTEAAVQAWNRPAVGSLTGSQVRRLMAGKKVQAGGVAQDDFLQLSMTGSPDDMKTGFELAHRLLTDPRLETIPFEQWRTSTSQQLAAALRDPLQSLQMAVIDAVYPEGETRARALRSEHVDRLSMRAAQAWLDRLVATGPIEVAIVGDIDRERAFELARVYLGSIASRERMHENLFKELSVIAPPDSDRVSVIEVQTQTPAAGVVAGFFGSDAGDVRDTRLLQMASRTLSSRLIERLRERERLVYSIGASVLPAEAYPGYGLVLAGSATDPGNADLLADRIAEIFAEFAESGPTEAEIETARAQVAKTLSEAFQEPSFWALQLSQLVKRGRDLDDLLSAIEVYSGFTAEEVRENFAAYHDRPGLRVIVRPAGADAP